MGFLASATAQEETDIHLPFAPRLAKRRARLLQFHRIEGIIRHRANILGNQALRGLDPMKRYSTESF
jgi:hypothetical protein